MRRLLLCSLLLCGCWTRVHRDPFLEDRLAVEQAYASRLDDCLRGLSPAEARKAWRRHDAQRKDALKEVYRRHKRPLPDWLKD